MFQPVYIDKHAYLLEIFPFFQKMACTVLCFILLALLVAHILLQIFLFPQEWFVV